MKKMEKQYSFCTCTLEHNKKTNCIYLSLYAKGKKIFNSTIQDVKASFIKVFFNKMTDADIKDMINHEMTHL